MDLLRYILVFILYKIIKYTGMVYLLRRVRKNPEFRDHLDQLRKRFRNNEKEAPAEREEPNEPP